MCFNGNERRVRSFVKSILTTKCHPKAYFNSKGKLKASELMKDRILFDDGESEYKFILNLTQKKLSDLAT